MLGTLQHSETTAYLSGTHLETLWETQLEYFYYILVFCTYSCVTGVQADSQL